ncbi:MAG: hypothetical protein D8M58_11320 [Calditrichaeota bacterium]|nr:MAG: hypothetical protein DWQ03_10695 [Calditrichota bacterium]MBL1205983.1 hypothetical protein [Calditrichota bacterium]NOG45811.1 endonuclease/exonuclease/phosphatase family protein [Calditrichota bacterium]
MKTIFILILVLTANSIFAQNNTIEIGTFNIEWFPCKDDGEMMKKYGIDLRYPPTGTATDVEALFEVLKELDIELLGVQEIVDPKLLGEMAKKYLGEEFEMIYSTSGGSQKVGFLYDSSVLELVGKPETYASLLLKPDSRLRPAYRAYFKSKSGGFDFHAIVVHLKASPRGWNQREQQLNKLEEILKTLPEESKDSDIILLGDMNNVTKAGAGEFTPMMERLGFYWASSELEGKPTNYWQPDWKVNKIKASTIDHIFVSADAKVEFVENSTKTSGGCSAGNEFYEGEEIPQYFNKVSDHCPVYGSFTFEKDDD